MSYYLPVFGLDANAASLHSADEQQKKEQADRLIGLFSGYLF
jgi:hypothetical protein